MLAGSILDDVAGTSLQDVTIADGADHVCGLAMWTSCNSLASAM
jgi:hypothetical protein